MATSKTDGILNEAFSRVTAAVDPNVPSSTTRNAAKAPKGGAGQDGTGCNLGLSSSVIGVSTAERHADDPNFVQAAPYAAPHIGTAYQPGRADYTDGSRASAAAMGQLDGPTDYTPDVSNSTGATAGAVPLRAAGSTNRDALVGFVEATANTADDARIGAQVAGESYENRTGAQLDSGDWAFGVTD